MDGIEAHAAVLTAHDALRKLISAIDPLLHREIESPGSVSRELRVKVKELCLAVNGHVDAEERLLRPILRRLDAWGSARVERMLSDHTGQRRAVAEVLLLANRRRHDAATLARAACELVDDLLADMEREEGELLVPLLDDGEVIVVRQHAE